MAKYANIRTPRELQQWLGDKPPEWSRIIVTRIVLRILPLTYIYFSNPSSAVLRAILGAWRLAFTLWVTTAYTWGDAAISGRVIARAARSLKYGGSSSIFGAIAFAGGAALKRHESSSAVRDLIGVARELADEELAIALWASVEADADWLVQYKDLNIFKTPLWLNEVRSEARYRTNIPESIRKPFDEFDRRAKDAKSHWAVFIAWYRLILPNRKNADALSLFSLEQNIEITLQPDSFWSGPANRVLQRVAAIGGWELGQQSHGYPLPDAGFTFLAGPSQKKTPSKKVDQASRTKPKRTSREAVETLSDEPTADDRLGRRPFARALVERMDSVLTQHGSDGFAVHIHGPWGIGKTSILRMMQEYLRGDKERASDRWVVINFNAWQHERRKPPWWPLIQAIKRDCGASLWSYGRYDRWIALQLRWAIWRLIADWFPFAFAAVGLFAVVYLLWFSGPEAMDVPAGRTVPGELPATNRLIELIGENLWKGIATVATVVASFFAAGRVMVFGSADTAKFYFDLSRDSLRKITVLFHRLVQAADAPICVFIDDLDRCNPDYVVDLLEGIQTSFRTQNVAYVVAADRAWIRSSFESRFGQFSSAVGNAAQPLGYLFLEKIFQVSTPVPGMGAEVRKRYWEGLLTPSKEASISSVEFDRRVDVERANLKSTFGENITRNDAEKALQGADTPVERAAVVLELTASPAAEKEAEHLLMQFLTIVPENPRVMKRLINAFAMRQAIGLLEGSNIPSDLTARWTILEQRFPALADYLIEYPDKADGFSKKATVARRAKIADRFKLFVGSFDVKNVIGEGRGRLTPDVIKTITRGSHQ